MGIDSYFESRAAYPSDCSVELPLSPSARAAPPSGPRLVKLRLRAGKKAGVEFQRALTRKTNTIGCWRT